MLLDLADCYFHKATVNMFELIVSKHVCSV